MFFDDYMVIVLYDVFGIIFYELKGSFLGMEFIFSECCFDGIGVIYEKDWEIIFLVKEVGELDNVFLI